MRICFSSLFYITVTELSELVTDIFYYFHLYLWTKTLRRHLIDSKNNHVWRNIIIHYIKGRWPPPPPLLFSIFGDFIVKGSVWFQAPKALIWSCSPDLIQDYESTESPLKKAAKAYVPLVPCWEVNKAKGSLRAGTWVCKRFSGQGVSAEVIWLRCPNLNQIISVNLFHRQM